MKSLLLLLLLPFLVLADSQESAGIELKQEEELTTKEFICGLVFDDDVEQECGTCADKAIADADITTEDEQDKYESEALAIIRSCSDFVPSEVDECTNDENPVACIDDELQKKESMLLAVLLCMLDENRNEANEMACFVCVYEATMQSLKSSSLKGVVSLRRSEFEDTLVDDVSGKCHEYISEQELEEAISESSK